MADPESFDADPDPTFQADVDLFQILLQIRIQTCLARERKLFSSKSLPILRVGNSLICSLLIAHLLIAHLLIAHLLRSLKSNEQL